jgi:hypothetical protein
MLAHRFQVLLDDERYRRVKELARERGVSTATVIREAIDRGLPEPAHRRRAAGRLILDASDMPVPEDLAELRHELDAERSRHA